MFEVSRTLPWQASASQMIMASLWVEIALESALGKQAGSMLSSSSNALSCSSGDRKRSS